MTILQANTNNHVRATNRPKVCLCIPNKMIVIICSYLEIAQLRSILHNPKLRNLIRYSFIGLNRFNIKLIRRRFFNPRHLTSNIHQPIPRKALLGNNIRNRWHGKERQLYKQNCYENKHSTPTKNVSHNYWLHFLTIHAQFHTLPTFLPGFLVLRSI